MKFIRENAFAYLHGHEVGGTNPSLLEAMASTKLNLLLDVGFNREVGRNDALYWKKNENDLLKLLNNLEKNVFEREIYEMKGNDSIAQYFSWNLIVSKYQILFLNKEKLHESIITNI